MRIALSHPTGNANVRAALGALESAEALACFFTTLSTGKDPAVTGRLLARALGSSGNRRHVPVPDELVRRRIVREATRHFAARRGWGRLIRQEIGWASVDHVYRDLDRWVARQLPRITDLQAVYAYEDGAAATFEVAALRGVQRVYELPVGYWKTRYSDYRAQAARQPEWSPGLVGLQDSPAKLARKQQEIEQADLTIVASTYSLRTLHDAGQKVKAAIIPYGAPDPVSPDQLDFGHGGALRVLFVGSVSTAKGVSYLFESCASLGTAVELTLVGSVPAVFPALEAQLARHRHIPFLPHSQLLPLMRRSDVLVLPSISDGFGLVILEALSQGLPVIASVNTGGPDVLTEGVSGFVVPVGSSQAIGEKLELMIQQPELLETMREGALRAAREWSWARYRLRLIDVLASHLRDTA